MKKNKLHHLLLFIILFTSTIYGQNIDSIYELHDSIIGTQNSHLFNGKIHTNVFRVLSNKNQFFNESVDYITGNITIDDISFTDVQLKYDVYSDELIIKPNFEITQFGIVIDPTKVNHFKLLNKNFIYLEKEGYYELITKNENYKFLIKHKKIILKKLEKEYVFYEFKNDYSYYCYYNNNLITLKSKKDFTKTFPNHKEKIESFYSQYNYLLKKKRYINSPPFYLI